MPTRLEKKFLQGLAVGGVAQFIDPGCFSLHGCTFRALSKDARKAVFGTINRHTFFSAH